NPRKDSHYMAITTRSGRMLAENTLISAEQAEELALETELAVEDEAEQLNLAKSLEPVIVENSQRDEGKAKEKE
ncbi:hypothetical protein HAX54_000215, partial [Datura stramonium]|nr:hypothetical protein [Datura stramonium]